MGKRNIVATVEGFKFHHIMLEQTFKAVVFYIVMHFFGNPILYFSVKK